MRITVIDDTPSTLSLVSKGIKLESELNNFPVIVESLNPLDSWNRYPKNLEDAFKDLYFEIRKTQPNLVITDVDYSKVGFTSAEFSNFIYENDLPPFPIAFMSTDENFLPELKINERSRICGFVKKDDSIVSSLNKISKNYASNMINKIRGASNGIGLDSKIGDEKKISSWGETNMFDALYSIIVKYRQNSYNPAGREPEPLIHIPNSPEYGFTPRLN